MKINKLLLLGALATLSFTACKNDKKELDEPQEVVSEESHVKPIPVIFTGSSLIKP